MNENRVELNDDELEEVTGGREITDPAAIASLRNKKCIHCPGQISGGFVLNGGSASYICSSCHTLYQCMKYDLGEVWIDSL